MWLNEKTSLKVGKDGVPSRRKTRVIAQGSHNAVVGRDKAAPMASSEPGSLFMALVAKHNWPMKMVDIITAFLQARFSRPGSTADNRATEGEVRDGGPKGCCISAGTRN